MGVKRLLLEGGGTANWSALRQGLVDEISVAISPIILGGPVTLVRGEGFTRISSAVGLRLLKVKRNADEIVLRYRVLQ